MAGVLGPVAIASPENMREIQALKLCPGLLNQKLWVGLAICVLANPAAEGVVGRNGSILLSEESNLKLQTSH